MTTARDRILNNLEFAGKPMTARDLSRPCSLTMSACRNMLSAMEREGLVTSITEPARPHGDGHGDVKLYAFCCSPTDREPARRNTFLERHNGTIREVPTDHGTRRIEFGTAHKQMHDYQHPNDGPAICSGLSYCDWK